MVRALVFVLAASLSGVAAANNDFGDGFIWIDANTRIKIKPTAAGGSSAPEKAPKTDEKKEKPKK